ncbi:hypothetical protein [Sandarakinorhabdus sp.]|uniref:hypothetical protein n=1 Tax=Sandarakinorhabdus sp. TaxID=1916663 RepID=UPI00286E3DAF|nr:hypothetical protein [Sandarakinorhabdus sp.]
MAVVINQFEAVADPATAAPAAAAPAGGSAPQHIEPQQLRRPLARLAQRAQRLSAH